MTLSAAEILGADDITTETVDCPEWGGSVLVKGMSGEERDEFEKSVRRNGEVDLTNYRSKGLVRVIVNENGTRIFGDKDAGALGKKAASVISRLWEVAARLSGLEDQEEEAEGNSEPTSGDDSSSSSPELSDAPAESSSPASTPES